MSVRRFTIARTIDGWEVIDSDGRPVDKRETAASANGVAYRLNGAAAAGPRALAHALRATPATRAT